jgi:hypothetical protein
MTEWENKLSQSWEDFAAFARRYDQETEFEGKEILILLWLQLTDARLRKLEETQQNGTDAS